LGDWAAHTAGSRPDTPEEDTHNHRGPVVDSSLAVAAAGAARVAAAVEADHPVAVGSGHPLAWGDDLEAPNSATEPDWVLGKLEPELAAHSEDLATGPEAAGPLAEAPVAAEAAHEADTDSGHPNLDQDAATFEADRRDTVARTAECVALAKAAEYFAWNRPTSPNRPDFCAAPGDSSCTP
jgi:hypothetical protein